MLLIDFYNHPRLAAYNEARLTKLLRIVAIIQAHGQKGVLQLRLDTWAKNIKMSCVSLTQLLADLAEDGVLEAEGGCIHLAQWVVAMFPPVASPTPIVEATRATSTQRVHAHRARRKAQESAQQPADIETSDETHVKRSTLNSLSSEAEFDPDLECFKEKMRVSSDVSNSVSMSESTASETASFSLASLAKAIYDSSYSYSLSLNPAPSKYTRNRMFPTENEILEILRLPEKWTETEVAVAIRSIQDGPRTLASGGIGQWVTYLIRKLPDIRANMVNRFQPEQPRLPGMLVSTGPTAKPTPKPQLRPIAAVTKELTPEEREQWIRRTQEVKAKLQPTHKTEKTA